jgi:predicted RecB family nuclease
MIDAWFAHMRTVRERFARGSDPRLIHWSAAEDSAFGTAYNAAVKRHPGNEWQDPNWFDFLTQVMRKEPVVVRGAMGFGLKAVARAMFQHGLIGTQWSDSITDGLGAMMAAWRSAEDAAMLGCRLADLPLMQEVVKYNEVDCRVMWEIVAYLRAHH